MSPTRNGLTNGHRLHFSVQGTKPKRVVCLRLPLLCLTLAVLGAWSLGSRAEEPPQASATGSAVKAARPHAKSVPQEQAAGSKGKVAENSEGSKESGDRDRKSLPPGDALDVDETGVIKGHAAWRWHLLTYPKKTIPSEPYTKAHRWIEDRVPEARPWGSLEEACGVTPEGIIATGTGIWTPIGPKPIDTTTQPAATSYIYGTVTGRFNALAVDQTTTTAGAITAYAAATAGGLWKSTNCCGSGTAWTPLWEGDTFVTQAVGAVEIDPNNHNVIYAGTGDFDANDQFGEGIMKSSDGGATWTQIGASVFTPYAAGTPTESNQNIGVIKIDPNNSNTVLAGTRYHLYISRDAGVTWNLCSFGANPAGTIHRISGLFLDSSTNPTTVYVAVGHVATNANGDNGVYKGTLAGTGCPTLTLSASGWPTGTGNGTNGGTSVGRIRLASSRGNATASLTIYAQVEDAANYNALGTWVTTNGGTSWTQLSGSPDSNYKACNHRATNEGQDWYDLFLIVDPGNDKTLYIGRTDLYQAAVNSTYTSMTITDLSNVYATSCSSYGTIHPDQHGAAWVTGTGGTSQFLVANDGGVYTANGTAGGFTQLNGSINATEFYAGQTSANLAGATTQYYFGGSQDNGDESWDSTTSTGGSLQWQGRANGGDGFFTAFDPIVGTLTTGNWFSEYTNGALDRSTAGARGTFSSVAWKGAGDNASWSTPYKLDMFHCTAASCPNLAIASQYFYVSAGGGGSFTKTSATDLTKGSTSSNGYAVITLDIAMSDPKSAVVGTDDGNVQWSNNVFTGTNCTYAAANTSTFACTENGSAIWVNLTQSNAVLPNRAIQGVTFDPTTNQKVYAAVGGFNANTASTPGHLFMASCGGSCTTSASWTWVNKTGNLPDVPAWSVVVNPNNVKQVFVGTDMGFFFTNDITASPPVWSRYQYGLPQTVIQYLAIDRGVSATPYASTTLTAFTYGRGAYSIRLPGTAGFDPHPVPQTMRAAKNGSNVDLTYDVSTCNNVSDNVYWGSVGNYAAVTGGVCGVGNSGAATGVAIPTNSWFVIVGSDGNAKISSFGTDSTGAQESFTGWQSASGCAANIQATATTCP